MPADVAKKKGARRGSGNDDSGGQGEGPKRAPASLSGMHADEVRVLRRKKGVLIVVLVAFSLASLCITNSTPMFVSPVEVVQCYVIRVQQMWCEAFNPANAPVMSEVLAQHPTYYWTLLALNRTAVLVLCGFMLAVSGALYQNVFRNPIAAPSMLGVSSGIQLAVAIAVLVFGTMVSFMKVQLYAISFVTVAVIIVVLFGLSALMTGKGRSFNVTNLLLVGVILNSFIGVAVTFISNTFFDEEQYDLFASLSAGGQMAVDPVMWAFLIVGVLVSLVPVIVLRFRMNALAFSSEEARMFGVDPTRMQLLALVCGTIAMVTAQLQVGAVAMMTLVVPHISRAVFGAEFRKQLAGTLLLGASVLLGCYFIASALVVPFSDLFPLNVVVNLVMLPAFVWMIATQQRRWD